MIFELMFAGAQIIARTALIQQPLQRKSTANTHCTVPTGWSEVAARKTHYIVFGELHGTREAPEFIARLSCGLAHTGKRILVAIEHEATDNAALQLAWRLPNQSFPAALRKIGWDWRDDGRGSQAMFDMIVQLHRLKTEGRTVDLVAFNGFSDEEQRKRFSYLPAQGPHEAAQAENIRRAAQSRNYDYVIVLVGNLHALKTPFGQGGVKFEPMAMRLGTSKEVTTLNMMYSEGSAWNCLLKPNVRADQGKPLPPNAMDCGIHKTGGVAVDLGRNPFIRLGDQPVGPPDGSYDGFFWLGSVRGSPPAVPKP
jgi:hypothetical protein